MVLGENVRKAKEQFEGGGPSVEMTSFRDSINSNNLNSTPATASPLAHTPSSRSHSIHNNFENQAMMKQSFKRSTSKTNNRAADEYPDEDWGRLKYFPGLRQSKWRKHWLPLGLGILCLIQLIALIVLMVLLISGRGSSGGSGQLSASRVTSGRPVPNELIFRDDFNTLNLTTWRHDRFLTDDGFVIYSSNPNNSYVEDGILFIQPTFTAEEFNSTFLHSGRFTMGKTMEKTCSSFIRTECDKSASGAKIINPVMSASVKTSQSFTFQYGVIEMRAKMPKGDWISTEISLMPRYQFYGEPTDTAKIVLITTRGNEKWEALNRTDFGNTRICTQLVYSDSQSVVIHSMSQYCQNSEPGDGFADDFHTYKFEWNSDVFKIIVDDRLKGKFLANTYVPSASKHVVITGSEEEEANSMSFNQQFYIRIRVGVGTGFPDTGFRSTFRKPWVNNAQDAAYSFWTARSQWEGSWQNRSSALQIDYIKVHAL